jgi:hypothetical protein
MVVFVPILAVLVPFFMGKSSMSPAVIQLVHLHELGFALRGYAEEHDGKFPAHISDLPAGSIRDVIRQFHDPVSQETQDWIYYPGLATSDPPDRVLLASPALVFKEKRIVGFADGSTQIIDESQFQQRLSVQPK